MTNQKLFYRWYKHFDQDFFNEILKNRMSLPNLITALLRQKG